MPTFEKKSCPDSLGKRISSISNHHHGSYHKILQEFWVNHNKFRIYNNTFLIEFWNWPLHVLFYHKVLEVTISKINPLLYSLSTFTFSLPFSLSLSCSSSLSFYFLSCSCFCSLSLSLSLSLLFISLPKIFFITWKKELSKMGCKKVLEFKRPFFDHLPCSFVGVLPFQPSWVLVRKSDCLVLEWGACSKDRRWHQKQAMISLQGMAVF